MLFNRSFNVGHLSCLQFSAVINSPVIKIALQKASSAVLDDFPRVDYQNVNYYFFKKNIFKTVFQAFGN